MKSSRKITVLLGLAGMCLTSGLLRAADFAGSFTLPSQTQWGSTVLPAGNYTFTLDHATLNGHVLVSGKDRAAFVMAQGVTETGSSRASSMLIVGGRVRSLHLGPVGLTYSYQIHPEEREILARSSAVPGLTISIATK